MKYTLFIIILLLTGVCATLTAAEQPTYAEDRAAIEDLMARYLFALDWNDFDSYVDTFTDDGELEYSRGTVRGRDEILATITSFKQAIGEIYKDEDGNPAVLRHVIGQTVIRVEGDRAWTRAFWSEVANNGAGRKPRIGTFGIYEDDLVRVNGEWKFKKRRVLNDLLEGRHSGPVNPVREMDEIIDGALSTRPDG
jgi:hypothetical protein